MNQKIWFQSVNGRGLFTWPNQDDQMNTTKIGEHDWKIDNDER